MKSKLFGLALTGILLLTLAESKAQSYAESALVFGRVTPGGSSRIQGIGGAQTALGGDYSSAQSNPAGLGFYNKSEFTFSPGYRSISTESTYLGNKNTDLNSKINIPGISFVLHIPQKKDGFIGGAVGFSVNRVNDFNQSFSYQGTTDMNVVKNNNTASIIDFFVDNAAGQTTAQFDQPNANNPDPNNKYNDPTGLAYFNYLIGPQSLYANGSPTQYFTDVSGFPHQSENVQLSGKTYQTNISYGGNYKDKLYFGGGIGITSLSYKSTKTYTETFQNDTLNSLSLNENLSVKGSGINLTLGFIGKPVDFLQLGLSYTTPTFYQLNESYDASMATSWNKFDYYGDGSTILTNQNSNTDVVTSDYTLTTSSKLSGGIALISKYGFITGDVELVNPGGAKYGSPTPGVSYSVDNSDIKSAYRRVLNYRIGAEFRYTMFRVRAGYNVQANSYKSSYDNDNTIESISGGVGVKLKKVSIDFALISSSGKNLYSPYSNAPTVEQKNSVIRGMLTFGMTF